MKHDTRLDPTKYSIQGWYYDTKEKRWWHRHKKGIWPFRKKYYVDAGDTVCPECGAWVPEDLKEQITEERREV